MNIILGAIVISLAIIYTQTDNYYELKRIGKELEEIKKGIKFGGERKVKRECKYIMNEEEITCIGDIRTARDIINKVLLNIDQLTKEETVKVLKACDERLSIALKKLEIN